MLNIEVPDDPPAVDPRENLCPQKTWNTYIQGSVFHQSHKVETTQVSIMNKRVNEMWRVHEMEYYLVVKRDEVLIQSTPRMDLENIVLSEGSQPQRTTCCIIPFLRNGAGAAA